jgi:hypothetical protein
MVTLLSEKESLNMSPLTLCPDIVTTTTTYGRTDVPLYEGLNPLLPL